jgi:hypothetical protein
LSVKLHRRRRIPISGLVAERDFCHFGCLHDGNRSAPRDIHNLQVGPFRNYSFDSANNCPPTSPGAHRHRCQIVFDDPCRHSSPDSPPPKLKRKRPFPWNGSSNADLFGSGTILLEERLQLYPALAPNENPDQVFIARNKRSRGRKKSTQNNINQTPPPTLLRF